MGYREFESETIAPGFLRGTFGARYLRARGAQKDANVDEMKQAVKARFPALCPVDALPLLGSERGIERGPGESDASYRERLYGAWKTWPWAGTAYGLLVAFYWAGYRPTAGKVVIQTETEQQIELRADFDPALHAPEDALVRSALGPVSLGGVPELSSDFAVLFPAPTLGAWVPTPPADNSATVNAIRKLILAWKPAHCRCVKLQATTGELWGYPTEVWGPTAETWDAGGSVTTWTPPVG